MASVTFPKMSNVKSSSTEMLRGNSNFLSCVSVSLDLCFQLANIAGDTYSSSQTDLYSLERQY